MQPPSSKQLAAYVCCKMRERERERGICTFFTVWVKSLSSMCLLTFYPPPSLPPHPILFKIIQKYGVQFFQRNDSISINLVSSNYHYFGLMTVITIIIIIAREGKGVQQLSKKLLTFSCVFIYSFVNSLCQLSSYSPKNVFSVGGFQCNTNTCRYQYGSKWQK